MEGNLLVDRKTNLVTYWKVWPLAIIGLWILVNLFRSNSSGLNSIPGQWHAKFTNIVLKKYTITGRRLHYIHVLHKQYGPVVRISLTEVDISDLKGFQEIHKIGSGFLKDPWYQKFRTSKTQDVFSVIDPKQHAAKRRLLARPFSNSSLRQNWEETAAEKVKMTVAKIKKEAAQGNSDVLQWWTFMTTDVIGQLAFGESFDMVETGKKSAFIEDLEMATKLSGIRAERVQEYGSKVVVNACDRNLGKANIFQSVMEESKKENTEFPDYAAAIEAGGLVVAGSGTTAITLTYLVWAVLSNPPVQHELEAEVAAFSGDFSDTDLDHLPYLNVVIQEALRLYGAALGSLRGVVPQSGLTVQGYYIPPGNTVCTQAYTIHRDPSIFAAPESFNPQRFIEMPAAQKAALSAFGAGSRTCLGVRLANMELRHAVAYFFRECKGAKLAQNMNNNVMEIGHFFLISPRGGRCEIRMT